jgi:predicted NBD/HSP70 family sugar kinase
VSTLADADEPAPSRVLREVGRILGRPLADVCTFLNPGVVILDGALGGGARDSCPAWPSRSSATAPRRSRRR